jgi:hypothetical protein
MERNGVDAIMKEETSDQTNEDVIAELAPSVVVS